MSFRYGLRAFQQTFARQSTQNTARFAQRRAYQSAAENPANIETPQQSKFQALWNSNVGPKTVHFWAPIMKVCFPWGRAEERARRVGEGADGIGLDCARMRVGTE